MFEINGSIALASTGFDTVIGRCLIGYARMSTIERPRASSSVTPRLILTRASAGWLLA
jgi:hypothetical protein